MPNFNTFYTVAMRGQYAGQAITNVLYYRLFADLGLLEWNYAGAELLAQGVRDTVWTPGLKNMVPTGYELVDITVSPRDNEFKPIHQLPFTLPVNENGAAAGDVAGPASCIIGRFQLEPTTIVNGLVAPKRGYLAVGPVIEDWIDGTGRLTDAAMANLAPQMAKFADNVATAIPPALFFPIRVKTKKLLGGLITLEGYADVSNCQVRRIASFRRSRLPEE